MIRLSFENSPVKVILVEWFVSKQNLQVSSLILLFFKNPDEFIENKSHKMFHIAH